MTNQLPIIYVVDDDIAILQSIKWLLDSADWQIQTYSDAQTFLKNYQPDSIGCLVSDICMPGMDGLELQEELINNNIDIPIIFMTGHGDVPMAISAMKAGAIEFLTKPFDDEILIETIKRGIEKDIERHKKMNTKEKIKARIDKLTPREKEVMKLIVAGKLNKIIASELKISAKTVELHRSKIMQKMEVTSLANLVKLYVHYYE